MGRELYHFEQLVGGSGSNRLRTNSICSDTLILQLRKEIIGIGVQSVICWTGPDVEDIGVISKSKDARSRRVGSQQVLGPDDGAFRPGLEVVAVQAMDEDDALGKSKPIWYIYGI
jgi:hypothetical protein